MAASGARFGGDEGEGGGGGDQRPDELADAAGAGAAAPALGELVDEEEAAPVLVVGRGGPEGGAAGAGVVDFESEAVADDGEADLDEAVGRSVGVLDGIGEELTEEEFGDVGVAVAGGESGEVGPEEVAGDGGGGGTGVEPGGERAGTVGDRHGGTSTGVEWGGS